MCLSRCKRRVNTPGIAQLEHGITVNLIRNKQGRIFACESLLNAAAGILAGGGSADFASAFKLAQDSLDSGAARGKLETLVEFSRQ